MPSGIDPTTAGSQMVYDKERIDILQAEFDSCSDESVKALLERELDTCKQKLNAYMEADKRATRLLGKAIVMAENIKREQENLDWAMGACRMTEAAKDLSQDAFILSHEAQVHMNSVRDKIYHMDHMISGFINDPEPNYRLYDLKGFVAKQEATKEEWDACVNGIKPWYPVGFRKNPSMLEQN